MREELERVGISMIDRGDHAFVGFIPRGVVLFGDQREVALVAGPVEVGAEGEDRGGGDEDDATDEKSPTGDFRGVVGGDGFRMGVQLFHMEQSAIGERSLESCGNCFGVGVRIEKGARRWLLVCAYGWDCARF